MKPLELQLRGPLPLRVDVSTLRPDRLRGLGVDAVRRLPLRLGTERVDVADLFEVSEGDANQVVLVAPSGPAGGAWLDRLGAEMAFGTLTVQGDAGAYAAQALRGGTLHVQGDCGVSAGAGMRGGMLRIGGSAGERLAGPSGPGERSGMRGGRIVVHGSAGAMAGYRLRRGTVVIRGDAAAYCGLQMIAGTIALGGATGPNCGYGMRRGTIVLATARPSLPATFLSPQLESPAWARLLADDLAGDLIGTEWLRRGPFQRALGDRSVAGTGEVLSPPPGRC